MTAFMTWFSWHFVQQNSIFIAIIRLLHRRLHRRRLYLLIDIIIYAGNCVLFRRSASFSWKKKLYLHEIVSFHIVSCSFISPTNLKTWSISSYEIANKEKDDDGDYYQLLSICLNVWIGTWRVHNRKVYIFFFPIAHQMRENFPIAKLLFFVFSSFCF